MFKEQVFMKIPIYVVTWIVLGILIALDILNNMMQGHINNAILLTSPHFTLIVWFLIPLIEWFLVERKGN